MQVGRILGAMAIGEGHTDAQVGLMVIATIFGMLAVAAGMAIHQRHPLSPWLLLGLVPTLIGIPFVFGSTAPGEGFREPNRAGYRHSPHEATSRTPPGQHPRPHPPRLLRRRRGERSEDRQSKPLNTSL